MSNPVNDEKVVQPSASSDYYFDSYSHFGIHEEMLKDQVRTRAYMNAIERNAHLFKGKVVMDVGCGTGILSMFAARAGASKVYAIDCSDIAKQAKIIIEQNGFSDIVEVIQGKLEDLTLPIDYVDIIVSEWMGYFLLYESMLDTVLYARDKWLRPHTGIMMPDKAVLYVCGIEDAEYRAEKLNFWDNVYGFDMSVIKQAAMAEPLVDCVDSDAVVTNCCPILHLDIMTCTKKDLAFASAFKIKANKDDYCHALVGFFECAFTLIHKPILFSTSPHTQRTHWKQTVFYLAEPLTICSDECITGTLNCSPNAKNNRELDIEVVVDFHGKHQQCSNVSQSFRLR